MALRKKAKNEETREYLKARKTELEADYDKCLSMDLYELADIISAAIKKIEEKHALMTE